MYNIPCNKDLLQASSIPLATVITPFAEPGPSEVSGSVIIYSKKKIGETTLQKGGTVLTV